MDVLAAREVRADRPFAILTSYAAQPQLYELPYFSGEFPGAVIRRVSIRARPETGDGIVTTVLDVLGRLA